MQPVSMSVTAAAIASIFLMGLAGFASVKRGLLSHNGLTEVSRLLVDFILPAAFVHSMYTQFLPEKLPFLGWAAGAQVFLFVSGAGLTLLASMLLKVKSHPGTVAALGSLQNNVYLPLPICIALLDRESAEQAQFFIGCFVLFFSPLLWSLGVVMLTWTTTGRQPLRAYLLKTLNPPFLGALAGLALKALSLGTGIAVPATLLNVAKLMGDATVPLAMIVLGGLLAEAKWSTHFEFKAVAAISIVKLGIVPLLALLILRNFRVPDAVFGFVFLLQATMPPATNISIVARRFGGNSNLVAVATFCTYMISLVTIPLWLVFYR
jgi:hypothetical protein